MTDRMKPIEVDGRKFIVQKFSAKTALKVSKLLIAKVLPVLDTFLPSLLGGNLTMANLGDAEWADSMLESLSLEKIAAAIDLIGDDDLDRLINFSLSHCHEALKGGPVQVLKPDGSYGVAGVEDDMMFTLRLTAEAVLWSVGGFFDASRWTSMFSPMVASFKQSMPMSMNSSSPPLPPDNGNNMNFGMALTP